jgi:hypothetical protein
VFRRHRHLSLPPVIGASIRFSPFAPAGPFRQHPKRWLAALLAHLLEHSDRGQFPLVLGEFGAGTALTRPANQNCRHHDSPRFSFRAAACRLNIPSSPSAQALFSASVAQVAFLFLP